MFKKTFSLRRWSKPIGVGIFSLSVACFSLFFPVTVRAAPCPSSNIRFASSSNTIYITGSVSCTLSEIIAASPKIPLEQVDAVNKIWLLRANLKLEQGATLLLHGVANGGDVNELRLKSNNVSGSNNIVWLRADWGTITIKDTKITSWNEAAKGPDTEYTTYKRSFIHVRSSLAADGVTVQESYFNIVNSDLGYLGYYAAESYGLSWKVLGPAPQIFEKVNVYGIIQNSHIHHNYFGIYTYGAEGMQIQNNEVDSNVVYGIDPHDDSDNLLIEGNYVHHNGTHGIICSQRCNNIIIRNNISEKNKGNGIMLHRNTNDSLVENNQVSDNSDSGIAIFDSHNNTIRNNTSLRNNHGIRFSVGSSGNTVEGNEFGNNDLLGIYFYKGSDAPTSGDGRPKLNRFVNNNVHDNGDYVIKLKEADGNIFENNSFTQNARELYMYDAVNNLFRSNTFSGNSNFYSARYNTQSTIVDTVEVAAKIGDSVSSIEIKSTKNYIFQNDKNIPTVALPDLSTLKLTRAISGNLVKFKQLNFAVIPATDQLSITPTLWQTITPFSKKWTAAKSSATAVNFQVGDLKADTPYQVLVNNSLWNTYTSNSEGTLLFTYDAGFNQDIQFEVKE